MRDAGWTGSCPCGENIAAYPTAQMVVDPWMNSPGHCSNLMSASYSRIGLGFATVQSPAVRMRWTADLSAQ